MIDENIDKQENIIVLLGGSGIHDSPSFEDVQWKSIDTGYSGGAGVVSYQQREDGVIFIPRHGHTVRHGPHVTPYAENLVAAKMLGADAVIATSAVGSLRKDIPVASVVIARDYVDETGRNDNIFFKGIVIHANPRPAFSNPIRKALYETGVLGFKEKFNGITDYATYVTIPGDRFGTAAEGLRRSQYADIVGMTCCPEASMALQLGMHYAIAAFVVDIDSDANHEGGTLEVMKSLSAPDKVPAYLDRVIDVVKSLELGPLEQIVGNIIPGKTSRIANKNLRKIAEDLIESYC